MRMLILFCVAFAATAQSADDERTRDIWDTGFRAKRPLAAKPGLISSNRPITYNPVAVAPPVRSSFPTAQANAPNQTVGITVWQLRVPETRDGESPRLLMQESPAGKQLEYVPHRIRLDQPLHVGDRVRVAIEFPQEGFLYVVDRERYRDGSAGQPYLIFPVQNLNHGNNYVQPGRLIEIPSQADPVTALNVVRRDERHIGEELLILFSPERLSSVPVSRPDSPLPAELVGNWERDWSVMTQRLDLAGDGGVWTLAEKAAGAEQRLLTQADPMPQSIFVAAAPPNRPFLLRLPLEVR